MPKILSKQVEQVGFGFYTPEEIKRLSVKRISVPYVFDNLGRPVPGGLYDPAMGPLDKFDRCETCTLPYKHCSGHLGHLDLSVPVYHPLLFDLMFKLLRSKCFCCHKFRISRLKLKKLQAKLALLKADHIFDAMEVDNLTVSGEREMKKYQEMKRKAKELLDKKEAKANEKARKEKDKRRRKKRRKRRNKKARDSDDSDDSSSDESSSSSDDDGIDLADPNSSEESFVTNMDILSHMIKDAEGDLAKEEKHASGIPHQSTHSLQFRANTLSWFFSEINVRKCQNCDAFSPSLRRQGCDQVYRLPLKKAEQQAMDAANRRIPSVLKDGTLNVTQEMEEDFQQQIDAKEKKQRLAAKKRRKAKKLQQDSDDDSDSSESSSDDSDDDENEEQDDSDSELKLFGDDANRVHSPQLSKRARKKQQNQTRVMFPNEAEKHLELLWQEEAEVIQYLWGSMTKIPSLSNLSGTDFRIFFLRTLCVPPPKFRPPTKFGDQTFDHSQNIYLKTILERDAIIRELQHGPATGDGSGGGVGGDGAGGGGGGLIASTQSNLNRVVTAWLEMQQAVNCLLDSSKSNQVSDKIPAGIKQLLEKKEGLFRRNMMGKRVNFACRSVISPDPFLATSEIGVPERFALELTYPQPVTPWNVAELRQAVINGAKVHPGANAVEDESGKVTLLADLSYDQRVAISKTLLTAGKYRNQRSTDAGGLNGEHIGVKTVFRHLKRGDAMLANRQPTLHKASIMAHKVRILKNQQTIRMHYANCNTYNADFDGDEINLHFPQSELARAEAYNIANTANQYITVKNGSPLRGLIQDHVVSGVLLTMKDAFFTRDEYQQLLYSTLNETNPNVVLHTPTPAVLKPQKLWTGKQLIGSILDFITGDKPKLNLTSGTRTPGSTWTKTHESEGKVVVRGNYLCQGVLDKASFGASKFGLVHACYELYGANAAGTLLSTLGRLFTLHLRLYGHTCGVDDMRVLPFAEAERTRLKNSATEIGLKTTMEFADVKSEDQLVTVLQEKLRDRSNGNGARLDSAMKTQLNKITTSIIKAILPLGTEKQFPNNRMALMVTSGAKGSGVNLSQISCLLGQQELEGRRVPLMASGKSLPSFRKYDPQPRAGGYVAQRFLSGIKPQEYYFHCMAGREGLVDTAVKTSRSGYLQRCLIKHLESLTVHYDYSVRDIDGHVVQFHYGEDSIDCGKASYMKQFEFLADNYQALIHKLNPNAAVNSGLDCQSADEYTELLQIEGREGNDPVLSVMNPGRNLGCMSESYTDALEKFIDENPGGHINDDSLTADNFRALMKLNYINALVAPGENVGCVAAQSVGEPSTQMTLNTFHLAGHGGANVTLGIPRLREIIMTASQDIGTPIMTLPLVKKISKKSLAKQNKKATKIATQFTRLMLNDFLTRISVRESVTYEEPLTGGNDLVGVRLFHIRLEIFPESSQPMSINRLKFKEVANSVRRSFLRLLNAAIRKQLKNDTSANMVNLITSKQVSRSKPKKSSQKSAEDAVQQQLINKKKEHVSYDDPDEEDMAIMKKQEEAANADLRDDESNSDNDSEQTYNNSNGHAMDVVEEDNSANTHSYDVSKFAFIQSLTLEPNNDTIEVVAQVPLACKKLLMMTLVEEVCGQVTFRHTPGIQRCFVVEQRDESHPEGKKVILQTDGVNFREMWNHPDLFDLNSITSNDIGAILRNYGVEACRSAIIHEVVSVFGVYGIRIDQRHLGLIADYMTFLGGYRPLNRMGMAANTSPFQKISFETSIQFLLDACLFGDVDRMTSPSSRIVLGRPAACGTGSFELLQRLPDFTQSTTFSMQTDSTNAESASSSKKKKSNKGKKNRSKKKSKSNGSCSRAASLLSRKSSFKAI